MNFVKLHQNGEEVLINMGIVSEIYRYKDGDRSTVYFNFADGDGMQVSITADESLDEIYEKMKGGE